MDKLKDNPRIVVVALIAAGIVALIAGGDSSKNGSNTGEVAQSETTTQTETATPPPETNSPVVVDDAIGSTPQAGPVEVKKEQSSYSSTVRKGDNQTVVVRQMVNEFLSDYSKSLSAEQRLYVETVVVDSLPRNELIFAGQVITVESSVISSAVDNSATLTEAQIARWATYL